MHSRSKRLNRPNRKYIELSILLPMLFVFGAALWLLTFWNILWAISLNETALLALIPALYTGALAIGAFIAAFIIKRRRKTYLD